MKKTFIALPIIFLLASCGQSNDPPYVGKWAGGPGWVCENPIIITAKTVSMEKGKTIPLVVDKDGTIALDKDGPYLLFLDKDGKTLDDGKTLAYSNPNGSGDIFELTRCK